MKATKACLIGSALLSTLGGGLTVETTLASDRARPQLYRISNQDTWNIERLLHTLTITTPHHINFQEQYVSSFLTEPIEKMGVLKFTPPTQLEKHVYQPNEESFIVNEDQLHYTNHAEDRDLTLSLSDYPPLQAFIEGLRSIFSGDTQALHQFYRTELQGTQQQWTLTIIPRDEELYDSITSILFQGQGSDLSTIIIHEAGSNHSILQLTHTPQ